MWWDVAKVTFLGKTPYGLQHTVTYAADMITLLAKLGVEQVDWLGTSMGGLIGMTLGRASPNCPFAG